MIKSKYIIVFIALLIVGMSVAVAADVDDSTSAPTKKVTKDTTKVVKNSVVTKKAIKAVDTKTTTKAKKTSEKVRNMTKKDDSKTVKVDVQSDEISSKINKKVVNNVKTDDATSEGQRYSTTYNGETLEYVVYPEGTLEFIVDTNKKTSVLGQMPIDVNSLGVTINNIKYTGSGNEIKINGGDYEIKNVGFAWNNHAGNYNSTTYENFKFTSVAGEDPDNVITIWDNVVLRNDIISCDNYEAWNRADLIIKGNNVLIENCEINLKIPIKDGEWVTDGIHCGYPNKVMISGEYVYTLWGSNIVLNNNTINMMSYDTDGTVEDYGYGISIFVENVTLTNNNINAIHIRPVSSNSTNLIIENNTIVTDDAEYTIKINGTKNKIRFNTLTAKDDKQGSSTILDEGSDNVIAFNDFVNTELRVISGSNVDLGEELPITILLKDKDTGVLLGGQDLLITVGDSEAVTVTTDEYGMLVYNLTSDVPGVLNVVIKCEGNKFLNESTETVEVIVNEDKDAIIADLNKTVQEQNQTIASNEEEIDELNEIIDEQDTQIESLENTTQALNNTVSQLEKDLTQAQEQLANNNNTNTNGTSSNNGTSNTNTTTTPTKTSVTLKLNPTTIYTGSKTKITATLKDANGKAVASQKISIKVGTKTYTVKTNKKGVATKTVKVTKTGKNKVTATFKATSKYAKAAKSATLTVKAKEKTKITVSKLSYKNKKITIKATIKAGKKALKQNTKLTIKVDGKTLTSKKISKKGKISLTLKKALKKGSHKVQIISKATSMYNQAKVTKTLKV